MTDWFNSLLQIATSDRPAKTPAVTDGPIIQLTPVVTLGKSISMSYDEDITLVLNLCLNHYQPDLLMRTSVLSMDGTFTQFVCDGAPCLPGSPTLLCSEDSPLPITTCSAGLNGKPKTVYITVHAAGGIPSKPAGALTSNFKFGASFETS